MFEDLEQSYFQKQAMNKPQPFKLLGDKIAVEFDRKDNLKEGLIHLAEDTIKNVRQATIRFLGNQMSDAALSEGSVVMVRISDCIGPIIKYNDSSLRLYNTSDVLCILSEK